MSESEAWYDDKGITETEKAGAPPSAGGAKQRIPWPADRAGRKGIRGCSPGGQQYETQGQDRSQGHPD